MTRNSAALDTFRVVEVTPLKESLYGAWNSLLQSSVNRTCFHELEFLGYHPAGRYSWHHLLFGNPGGPDAVLPAAIVERPGKGMVLESPAGATLGGFALRPQLGMRRTVEIVASLIDYARELGVHAVSLGAVPSIYWRAHDDRLEFALQSAGFECTGQLMFYVDLRQLPESDIMLGFPGPERAGLRKALRQGLTFEVADTPRRMADFYDVLCANKALHNAAPVHSLDEILSLKERLGPRLGIYTASLENKLVAGVYCVRVTDDVCYTQYIADAPEFRRLDATRFLLCELMRALRADGVSRLDLGPSLRLPIGEMSGARFKESFGAIGCERRQWHRQVRET